MRAILRSLGSALAIIALLYVANGVKIYLTYTKAFDETHEGESLQVVLDRFGPPSHIEPRYDVKGYDEGSRSVCGQSCWIRLWYELPFTLGTSPLSVDFNAQQKVIYKYQWSSP